MTRQVKIKVRPQQTIQFPGICVHCSQPAPETMIVRQRNGRITRSIHVPLCQRCADELNRHSADEERLTKISWLVGGVSFLLGLAVTLLLTPATLAFGLRLLIALLVGAGLITAVFWGFRKSIGDAALPEKQSIRQSVAIKTFSWRATTFAFENDLFADRFVELNAARLMEI
ncbi:hypothetical protein MNBD_CHLOROFLEXI01-692 [hydrothermal vent metagenome]|uniref:Uncharacterized protein n=1 Tax=hydrothermal vent metagenome TaxID=652676 RepID=A0A3B0W1Q8_9ZZZZ